MIETMTQTQINWKNPTQKISKYFSVGEVTKGDARRIPQSGGDIERNILQLAIELDKIREEWGSPVIVTSWYRPPAVNRAVGGSPNSQHLYARAVDIRPNSLASLIKFQAWLDQHWFGALGYGAKKGFVHLDRRNAKGWRSGGQKGPRWNY
jgi:putative chitinase